MRRRVHNGLPCYGPGLLRSRSASAVRNRGRGFFPAHDDDGAAVVQWSKRHPRADPLDRGSVLISGDSLGTPKISGIDRWLTTISDIGHAEKRQISVTGHE